MDPLESIPSPLGHVAREVCHRALPPLVFSAVIAVTLHLWKTRFAGSELRGEGTAMSTHFAYRDAAAAEAACIDSNSSYFPLPPVPLTTEMTAVPDLNP